MEIKYHFDMTKIPAKLNPQQGQMVEGLKAASAETMTKEEILEAITPVLVTKQDPWLIFKYYQPTFIEAGMLSLDKINKPKAVKTGKRDETVTLVVMGPPKPAEKVESIEELEAAGF